MEAEPTKPREMRDEDLNAALEAHTVEDLDGLNIQNHRLARIQEYEEEVVSRSNPYAAMIGVGSADFQRIFEHYSKALLEELDSRHTFAEVRELNRDIRLLETLRRAVEADLEFQSADAGQPVSGFPHSINVKGLSRKAVTNKCDLVPKRWMGNG
jgi:hypothetical protein